MLKVVYLVLGILCVVLGVIGIFLPVLPTTPFLIFAAFFFSRSSSRFHQWLMNHKHFGPPIHDWNTRGVIRRAHKTLATIMFLISAVVIMLRPQIPLIGKISFAVFMIAVLIFIWTRPSQ